MRKFLLFLMGILVTCALCAQEYNVTMPGQKKVTTVDSTGTVTTQNVTDNDSEFIQYRSGSWFYKGETMNEAQFLAKMKAECNAAYQRYQAGVKQKKTGIVLAVVGGATLLIGGGFMIGGAATSDERYYYDYAGRLYRVIVPNWAMYTGYGMMIAGTIVTLGASIPCILLGQKKKNNAHIIYNRECASPQEAAVTMNIGFTGNGIGVAVNF